MTHTELLTALRDGKLRVVPAEPTQEMDDSLDALPKKYGCNFVQLSAPEIWPALCAASPDHTAALLDYIAGLERDAAHYAWRKVADELPPACCWVWCEHEGAVWKAYTGTRPIDIRDEGGVTHWVHSPGRPLPPIDTATGKGA
jgi:hypothetical protein